MNYEKHLYDSTFETEAQQEIRILARKFARDKILPLVEKDEESQTFRPEIIQGLGELGLTGIPTEEDYGGAGMGYQEYAAAVQEIAAVNAARIAGKSNEEIRQLVAKLEIVRRAAT